MTSKLFMLERVDSKSMVYIGYRLTQITTFALSFSGMLLYLVLIKLVPPSMKTPAEADPLTFLFGSLLALVGYLGLITAMGNLIKLLYGQEPRTLLRQAALICSEPKKFERYLDLAFGVNALHVISVIAIWVRPTYVPPEGFCAFFVLFSTVFLTSVVTALLVSHPKATKAQIDKLSDRLNKELTGISGVDMNKANNLLTLLILQGKYKEADELSRKLISLAEQSPELIS
ncbi:MAG: hypothetical protein K2X93_18515 [Candidatus Obscuribacterales bacterium]|nr:hypothetical protein [Candidatus Obscuribacterales bacterium]